jgi:hypothetical protein
VVPSLLRGAFCLDDGGKESLHGDAGRWLHPPVEAGARATVHPRHPCVFEQGVAAPVVLPLERRWEAPVVFSTSGDRRRQQLALWGPARETEESLAPSGGLAEAQRPRSGGAVTPPRSRLSPSPGVGRGGDRLPRLRWSPSPRVERVGDRLPRSRWSPSPGVGRGGDRLPRSRLSPSPGVGRGGASYGARG